MDVGPDELILPDGVRAGWLDGEPGPETAAIIDNRTGLPDDFIEGAARTFIEETSAFNLRADVPIQMYNDYGGNLMARSEFRTPLNVHEEIKLARWLAERDDDVGAVLGEMVALAFSEGLEVQHPDERTQALFCSIAESMDLEAVLANMYREWLIASQCTTAMLFSREDLDYEIGESSKSASMAVPNVGVLASEQIRVLGNDTFGNAVLAYQPEHEKLRRWLSEYFAAETTPARKAEMGRQDRVAANLFVRPISIDPYFTEEQSYLWSNAETLYVLNPKIVQRLTMPKGAWKDPRPLLTRNFPLLEAKRLLNIMDFALLQGGANFIVVAKKGSDQRPAKPNEISNLREVVRRASKVGLIVGDHRLSFEVITPKLDELLNPSKRRLIGRKMVMAMMRVAEHSTENSTTEGMQAEMEIFSRVIAWDRRELAKHMTRRIFKEAVNRNPKVLKGPACVWFPKIILQGSQYFADFVLKLRDRGDISRKSAVQAAGFDYDSELQERKRELAEGHDEILIPGSVPHNSPELPGQRQPGRTPADNEGGRPPGGGGGDPGRERQVVGRKGAETIKAWFEDDPEIEEVVRMGEIAMRVLADYPERTIGRMGDNEREALRLSAPARIGSTLYVPVNPDHEVTGEKAVRLEDGLSMLVGTTAGGAVVSKVLCFRQPTWTEERAEETALRWGYEVGGPPEPEPTPDPTDPEPEETAAAPPIEVHLHLSDDRTITVKPEPEPKKDPEPEPEPSGGGS